jgi:hypothetical protein
MDKLIFTEKMKALSTGSKNRTAHARIEDDFSDIEIGIIKKVNRKAIWEAWNELQPDELKVPQKTFESAVYRILNKRTGQSLNILASRTPEPTHLTTKGANLDPVIKDVKAVKTDGLGKPSGMADAEWNDKRQKQMAEERRQRNLLKGM